MLAGIKKANAYQPSYIMKDAVFLPDDDITSIKQAILDYGSVSAGIAVQKMSVYAKYFYDGSKECQSYTDKEDCRTFRRNVGY